MIKSLLLIRIIVVLILRRGMRTIKPLRLEGVLISGQKVWSEPIDRWGPRPCHKTGFSGRICGHWIGRKIMVERNVLLEDDHEMLDGIGCFGAGLCLPGGDFSKGSGKSDCRQTNGLYCCHLVQFS